MKKTLRIFTLLICILGNFACSTNGKRSVETGVRTSYKLERKDGNDVGTMVTETCAGYDDLDFPDRHRGQCYKKTCIEISGKSNQPKEQNCTFEGNPELLKVYSEIAEVREKQLAENRKNRLQELRTNCFQNGLDSCLEWIDGDYFSGLDVIHEICQNKKFKCETTFLESDSYGGRNRECVHGKDQLICEHSKNRKRYKTKLSLR